MRGYRWRLAGAMLVVLCLYCALGLAQETAPAPAGGYRVAGRVVSVDGRPLQRAQVRLRNAQEKEEASQITDEEGRFAFTGVSAGLHALQGQAKGYVTADYQAHGMYSTGIVTGAGVDTESLELKLMPEGSIGGRVTDEAGEPVRRANIALYRENRTRGIMQILRTGFAQTDERGMFELGGLSPGRYYVSASARPWYAVYPRPRGPQEQVPAQGLVDGVDASLNVAYSTMFYPGATDSSGAQAIELKGGEERSIDLRLFPEPAFTLTVPRSPAPQGGGMQGLQREVFGRLESINAEMQGSETEFHILGVPAGKYVLPEVAGQAGQVTKRAAIDLTRGDAVVDPASEQPLGTVKATLRGQDGSKLPEGVVFALIPDDRKEGQGRNLDAKGEATIDGLTPGGYYVSIWQGNRSYFVTSLSIDGKAVTGDEVRVTGAAPIALTVTAARASGRVEGIAAKDGKPAPGVLLLMLSNDARYRAKYQWVQQSDLDGSFQMDGVPPGRYTLMAIEDGFDLEWQKAEVVSRYLPLGVAVVVPANSEMPVKLTAPVPVQPR